MDYNEFLNNIYSQFKNSNQYMSNNYIKFLKENNTNIVNFEFDNKNYELIRGTIIEQANSVLIYFNIENKIVLSKANIVKKNIATITNILLDQGYITVIERIKRKFEQRKELYKASSYDEFINGTELDSELTYLISNIIEKYNQKNMQKRHKI
ncbi:MAG: hypothetical protein HFI87_05045 [Bacilli bacterium]|nr:hypothetical protein [Bacilli bacterium]